MGRDALSRARIPLLLLISPLVACTAGGLWEGRGVPFDGGRIRVHGGHPAQQREVAAAAGLARERLEHLPGWSPVPSRIAIAPVPAFGGEHTGGLSLPGEGIVIPPTTGEGDLLPLTFHELAHYHLHELLADLPPMLEEGVVEVLAQVYTGSAGLARQVAFELSAAASGASAMGLDEVLELSVSDFTRLPIEERNTVIGLLARAVRAHGGPERILADLSNGVAASEIVKAFRGSAWPSEARTEPD